MLDIGVLHVLEIRLLCYVLEKVCYALHIGVPRIRYCGLQNSV